MTTTATRRRPNTRERILAASLELFLERGFDGTSISDIERAVGLAAGTGSFYRHFRSKEDVFVAAIQRSATEYIEQFLTVLQELDAIDDPVERLRRDFHMRLDAMQRFAPVMRVVTAERERFPELQRTFTAGLELDQWRVGWNEHRLPGVVMAALVGYGQLSQLEDSPYRGISADEFIDELVAMLTSAQVVPPLREH
ncbi:MAG TPA: helix-turn-helix domain-containing protein [Acidimicrobiia bacterium]|jgi:AcrR family transcriptional regulator|nr:helix-turn-helix domain-containing protein [Acidimicrobiia bacterium]